MTHQHVTCSCLKGETVPSATLLPKNVTISLVLHYISWTLRRSKNPLGYRIRQYYEYMYAYENWYYCSIRPQHRSTSINKSDV